MKPKVPYNGDKTECKRGHAFTPENTYIRKDGHGRRTCSGTELSSGEYDNVFCGRFHSV